MYYGRLMALSQYCWCMYCMKLLPIPHNSLWMYCITLKTETYIYFICIVGGSCLSVKSHSTYTMGRRLYKPKINLTLSLTIAIYLILNLSLFISITICLTLIPCNPNFNGQANPHLNHKPITIIDHRNLSGLIMLKHNPNPQNNSNHLTKH